DDLFAVYEKISAAKTVLAGFSFGAAMVGKLSAKVSAERMVLVGAAVANFEVPAAPAGTLVIHGEQDTTVPLAAAPDWAPPQELPGTIVPGADHFFHRKLHVLRDLIKGCWR